MSNQETQQNLVSGIQNHPSTRSSPSSETSVTTEKSTKNDGDSPLTPNHSAVDEEVQSTAATSVDNEHPEEQSVVDSQDTSLVSWNDSRLWYSTTEDSEPESDAVEAPVAPIVVAEVPVAPTVVAEAPQQHTPAPDPRLLAWVAATADLPASPTHITDAHASTTPADSPDQPALHFNYLGWTVGDITCDRCQLSRRTEVYQCTETDCREKLCRECILEQVSAADNQTRSITWTGVHHAPFEVAWKRREASTLLPGRGRGIEPFEFVFARGGHQVTETVFLWTIHDTVRARFYAVGLVRELTRAEFFSGGSHAGYGLFFFLRSGGEGTIAPAGRKRTADEAGVSSSEAPSKKVNRGDHLD